MSKWDMTGRDVRIREAGKEWDLELGTIVKFNQRDGGALIRLARQPIGWVSPEALFWPKQFEVLPAKAAA